MRRSSLSAAILFTLSSSSSGSGLDFILNSNNLFKSTFLDIKKCDGFRRDNYSINNYNCNFNSKGNMRKQVYNTHKKNKYSRKHN
jgi:hypothetical protein